MRENDFNSFGVILHPNGKSFSRADRWFRIEERWEFKAGVSMSRARVTGSSGGDPSMAAVVNFDDGGDGGSAATPVFETPQLSVGIIPPQTAASPPPLLSSVSMALSPPALPPSWRRFTLATQRDSTTSDDHSVLGGGGGDMLLGPESSLHQSTAMLLPSTTFNVLRQIVMPILPMLGSAIHSFDDTVKKFVPVSAYVFETKYDGERALAVVRNTEAAAAAAAASITNVGYCEAAAATSISTTTTNQVEMFTRTLKPLTVSGSFAKSPVRNIVLKNNTKSIVLDGELVFVDTNTGVVIPICDTGERSAMRCVYMVFDVQQVNGRDTTNDCLSERKTLLSKHVVETDCVKIVGYDPVGSVDRLRAAFDKTVASGGEGLMVKKLTDPYVSNSRKFWFKLKPVHIRDRRLEFDLYAIRAYRDRTGTLAILQCGYFEDSPPTKWKPVCRVSSGIRDCDKTRISLLADSATGRFKLPLPIVTVTADKITERNRSLRHPAFVRFAFEKDTVDSLPFQ